MKQGILSITICPEDNMFEKIEVQQSTTDENLYDVSICTLIDEPYSSIVNNQSYIDEIYSSMEFGLNYEEFADSFEFYRYVLNHCKDKDFFSNPSCVYINGIYEDIVVYLKKNPELLDKEIVLAEGLELNRDVCERIKYVFRDFPNIKLMVRGNRELISITEYEKTIYAIDAIVDKIKRYDYSPLEQLILAYDLIRDRFYVMEDENEKYSVSRDLTSTLLGDKIVCVGFANIFDTVCKKLDINSFMFFLNNRFDPTSGHARNMLFLQDEKYGIEGIYFFDPTFDCKKDENNNFLFSYKFFAKDYIEMDELSRHQYMPREFMLFDEKSFYVLMDKCERLAGDTALAFRLLTDYRINTLLKFVGKDTIQPLASDYEPEDIIDGAYDVKVLAENPIGAEKFLKALYTVRKNQYYENPSKYMFDVHTLVRIIANSRFRADDTAELSLLAAMGFTCYYGKNSSEEKVKKFVTKNGLDVDIERTKVARCLRSVLEKRQDEENRGKKL